MAVSPRIGICQVCKRKFPARELFPAQMVRASLLETIVKRMPDWFSEGFICIQDLNALRIEHIQEGLKQESGQLSALEDNVIQSIRDNELLVRRMNVPALGPATFGERLSDRIAEFGGSWKFTLTFVAILIIWIAANSFVLLYRPFDPFPFILLNLVLSCVAALEAPVIMMSQNRQEDKDRLRAENDYQVNLKAELEIRHINDRIDFLVRNQWDRLMEIQQMQMEMIEQLRDHIEKGAK